MAYLIDTNIAIHARDGTESVLAKLAERDGGVLLSALSLAELQRGLYKDPIHTALRQVRLGVLVEHIPILPFDAAAAQCYGQIIAQCGWVRGRDYDRMIAAHAISVGAVLVTNNETDFRDIPKPVPRELGYSLARRMIAQNRRPLAGHLSRFPS